MRKYISYILATALLFVCCAKTEVGLDESEVLVVSTNNIEVDADANEVTVLVNSLSSYSVSCDVGWREWVTASAMKGASGKTKIKFSFAQNNTISPRNATITIENSTYGVSETISVSQEAGAPFIKSSVTEISADVERFTTKIDVDSNIDYTISSSEKWCHLGSTSGKSGKTTLDITIDANTDTLSRKATITLENKEHKITKTVSVSQGAFNPVVTVETEKLEFAAEGGEKYVEINANCEYKATTDADWLSVEQTSTGIKVTALSYIEFTDRTADITITNTKYNLSQTIKATQGAFVPNITAEQATLNFTSDGGNQLATITSNIEYEVAENADWLSVAKSSTGVNITALPNEEEQSRTADITLTNAKYSRTLTLKVTQAAFVPVLTVESTNLQYSVEGGPKSVSITSNLDYQVTKTVDWLTVEKSGSGITISASAYTGDSQRATSVVVSNEKYSCSQTVNVIQLGIRDLISSEPNRVLVYTTSDNSVITPKSTSSFGAKIVLNSYLEGCGYIIFDKPITSIGDSAFYDCSALTSITIPNSVTSIGNQAFYDCSALTSITIPNSVTSIGNSAFMHCDGLTSITIPNSVTSIGYQAFAYCTSLTSVTIPNSVTSIGYSAFHCCSNLKSITIPNSVTSIGNSAFFQCFGLTSITIGNSVTSIGNHAFYECRSLTSITIPNSVTSIGDYAFCECRSLTSITIPNGVTKIGSRAFTDCEALKEFKGKFASSDGRCLIVDGVLNSFAPSGLTTYTIPNSVTSIGYSAFYDCDGLTSITIPNSVTSIGVDAFYYCSALTSITIPNSVTSIGNGAFMLCYGLTSITIPNSVTSIGDYAFYYCIGLTSVYCKTTTPPTLGGSHVFDENYSSRKIYVPTASVSAYKSDSYWSEYASSIVGYF